MTASATHLKGMVGAPQLYLQGSCNHCRTAWPLLSEHFWQAHACWRLCCSWHAQTGCVVSDRPWALVCHTPISIRVSMRPSCLHKLRPIAANASHRLTHNAGDPALHASLAFVGLWSARRLSALAGVMPVQLARGVAARAAAGADAGRQRDLRRRRGLHRQGMSQPCCAPTELLSAGRHLSKKSRSGVIEEGTTCMRMRLMNKRGSAHTGGVLEEAAGVAGGGAAGR